MTHDHDPDTTQAETHDSTVPAEDRDRDRGSETAAVLPVLGDLTYDEVHAAYLGTSGLLVGLYYADGHTAESLGFSMTVIGLAFGIRVFPRDLHVPGAKRFKNTPHPLVTLLTFVPWVLHSAAGRTVRREPWYFLGLYLVSFLAGTGLAVVLVRAV